MLRPVTLSIIFSSLLSAQQSFEDFKRQQEQAFSQYKESVTKDYAAYEAAEKAAFEEFKEDVERLVNLKKKYNRMRKNDYTKYEKLIISHCNFLWNNQYLN